MRCQCFEIIDNILMELNRKFKQTELIEAMESCNLNSKLFSYLNKFLKLPGISTDKQFFEMCVSESNFMEIVILIKNIGVLFLQIEKVYRRILVIPVSSPTAERSISIMRRIKIYNGSTKTGKQLHNLAL